ncbi:MAG: FtsH protease activity modulator HflK [Alphaproteobacteria bacterium]|nr:FtsH protease activity modulator HflK [Alphaproteobacteria bacterium]
MPWNQGGGPWGSGGGQKPNPWGGRPGGGGPFGGGKGPDFEDIIREGQERLRHFLPGGMGAGRGLMFGFVALVAIWLTLGFYQVRPDQQGVVLRFGEWVRTAQPGLNYHLPWPVETVLTPSVTAVNTLNVGFRDAPDGRGRERPVPEEALLLTGDANIIDVRYTVFWRIRDAGQFLFSIASPESTVKAVAESAMREAAGQMTAQEMLTEGRAKLEERSTVLMQSMLDTYQSGVQVSRIELRAVDPPAQVVDAFRDVQRARADRERTQNEAESYRNDIVPRARGEAQRILQEAEGYRQQVVARAQGDVAGYLALLEAYRIAPEVTRQRLYLETMESVLRGNQKVILDQNGSAAGQQGVIPLISLNELMRRAPAPAGQAGQPGAAR